jgi:cyclase
MQRVRIIPVLQIENRKLVKTTQFKSPVYVGDPLNALRIFNDKLVDEVAVVDIGATRRNAEPDIAFIKQLASECFMPMAYGGGVTSLNQAADIFQSGIEKIIIGSAFHKNPKLVTSIANRFGAQSIVVSIDVKKNWLQAEKVFICHGTLSTGYSPVDYAKRAVEFGAGEILLNVVEKEGTGSGYDCEMIEKISAAVDIPVVALCGAGSVHDFKKAVAAGASAVAAGSLFVFKGPHKAVLISYPDSEELNRSLR